MLLVRLTKSPTVPTFGVLIRHDGIPFALTLERPWLDNARHISCIPAGSYSCQRVQSPKFGDTFQVTDVPGRSEILFHRGNLMEDTHGCILVGEQFGRSAHGEPEIIASRHGFAEFMGQHASRQNFMLTISYAA